MKRIVVLLAIMAILYFIFNVSISCKKTEPPKPILMGDVNGDAVVDSLDCQYLTAYVFKEGPAPVDTPLADLNKDGKINVQDVVILCKEVK